MVGGGWGVWVFRGSGGGWGVWVFRGSLHAVGSKPMESTEKKPATPLDPYLHSIPYLVASAGAQLQHISQH